MSILKERSSISSDRSIQKLTNAWSSLTKVKRSWLRSVKSSSVRFLKRLESTEPPSEWLIMKLIKSTPSKRIEKRATMKLPRRGRKKSRRMSRSRKSECRLQIFVAKRYNLVSLKKMWYFASFRKSTMNSTRAKKSKMSVLTPSNIKMKVWMKLRSSWT